MNLDDPMERDALAGEYVLGTLAGADRAAFEQQAGRDIGLARLVRAWEERLAGLSAITPPAEPPAELWGKIAASLRQDPERAAEPRRVSGVGRQPRPGPSPAERLVRRLRRELWAWRLVTLGSTAALAAGLLLLRLAPDLLPGPLRPPETQVPLVAVLQQAQAPGGWLIRDEAAPRRTVVQPINQPSPGQDRDFELWLVPQGGAPVPLGLLLPDEPTVVSLSAAQRAQATAAGALLAVSIEPTGGSPTGSPTGPVVYTGQILGRAAN